MVRVLWWFVLWSVVCQVEWRREREDEMKRGENEWSWGNRMREKAEERQSEAFDSGWRFHNAGSFEVSLSISTFAVRHPPLCACTQNHAASEDLQVSRYPWEPNAWWSVTRLRGFKPGVFVFLENLHREARGTARAVAFKRGKGSLGKWRGRGFLRARKVLNRLAHALHGNPIWAHGCTRPGESPGPGTSQCSLLVADADPSAVREVDLREDAGDEFCPSPRRSDASLYPVHDVCGVSELREEDAPVSQFPVLVVDGVAGGMEEEGQRRGSEVRIGHEGDSQESQFRGQEREETGDLMSSRGTERAVARGRVSGVSGNDEDRK